MGRPVLGVVVVCDCGCDCGCDCACVWVFEIGSVEEEDDGGT